MGDIVDTDILTVLDQSVVGEEEIEEVTVYNEAKDLIEAESMMVKIRVSTTNIERFKEVSKIVQKRAKELIVKEEEEIDKLTAAIQPFVTGLIENNLKVDPQAHKSIKFLSGGKAGFRAGSGVIQIDDMQNVAEQANELGVPTKMTVSKNDLKKLYKELPEEFKKIKGASFIKTPDSFYITA